MGDTLDNDRMSTVMAKVYNTLQDNYNRAESIIGVPTGYKDVDDMTHGLQRGDLIVVGARPSVGKTSWLINLASNTAIHGKDGKTVAFFTLEKSKDDLGIRMLAVEARIDISRMYSGQFAVDDWRKLATASSLLAEASIYVDDSCSSVLDIRKKCQQIKCEPTGLDLVLVDYLQLIGDKPVEGSEHDTMHELKLLAKELDVPVVLASQLNSELEKRADKRPMLCDFREGLAIEQYADVVMFIFRDEIYHKRDYNKGKAEIIITKNLSGAIGSTELVFLDKCGRFENMVNCWDERVIYEQYVNGDIV